MSTWLFHQPPALVFQPVPLAAQSSPPLSPRPWHVRGSLAAAWQLGKARLRQQLLFQSCPACSASAGAACQGEGLPAAGRDGAGGRRGAGLHRTQPAGANFASLQSASTSRSRLPSESPRSLMYMQPSTGEQMEEEPSGFYQARSQVGAGGAAGTKDGIAWEHLD